MRKSIIVAAANDGCIGKDGRMPWHFSEDMRWFRRTTWDHPVIMGRKTYESIKDISSFKNVPQQTVVLPGRHVIVLSKKYDFTKNPPHIGNVSFANSLEDALALIENSGRGQVYIAGGAEIYKLALPIADEIVLSQIPGDYEGDTFFPVWPISLNGWKLVDQYWTRLGGQGNPFTFKIYQR